MIKKFVHKISTVDKVYLAIFFLGFLLIVPSLFYHGIRGDDSVFHIFNTRSIFLNFPSSIYIRPVIANNLGYGTGLFYPVLPHLCYFFIARFFALFQISATTSYQIANMLLFMISGALMYRFMKLLLKNRVSSFLSTLLYLTFPYFLGVVYTRGAFSESFIFIALPLIFSGIYHLLYEKDKQLFYLEWVIGFTLLFNSHFISSLYCVLFVGIFLLTQGKRFWNKEVLSSFLIGSGFAFLFALPSWIPMIEQRVHGNYMAFADGHMSSPEFVQGAGLPLREFYAVNGNIPHFLPIPILFLTLFGIYQRCVKKPGGGGIPDFT